MLIDCSIIFFKLYILKIVQPPAVFRLLSVSLSNMNCNFFDNATKSPADSVLHQTGGAPTSTTQKPLLSADQDTNVLASQQTETSSSQTLSSSSQGSVLDVNFEFHV